MNKFLIQLKNDQIVKLGEKALPYLDNIIKNTDDYSCKVMAKHVENVIKPELYDLSFNSPKENISLSSDDAAYWAGFCVLLGYGYNPIHLDPNKPAPYLGTAQAQSWVSEAILRGGYARDVYKVMIGKSII